MKQFKRNIAVIFIASIFTSLFSITPANAADYRYWTFWVTTNDSWSFANEGAGTLKATDQMVTGWKFAITGADNGLPPTDSAVFAELCPDTSEQAGTLRVAVVVDFNDQATAPEGETPPSSNVVNCVTVNEGQTAADALNAAGLEVRANDGFVCGINGYPKEECGIEIASTTSDPTAMAATEDMTTVDTPADEEKESTNTNVQLIGLAAVLIIAFAVVLKMRKKK
ncbi:MAG: hypothetical protein RLY38_68 [Actinomycetota bacterium]|jgi:hypothetical protein